MATAIDNALLALQLFGAPAQQFNQQNDARTATLLKLSMANQADQRARQLAADQNQRYIDLETLRSNNSQALADKTATRDDARALAMQTRQDAQNKETARRQDASIEAADLKQLRAAIATNYPKYAAQATRLGEKVRPITDFPETWEGLGDIQGEMTRLEQTGIKRDQQAAAMSAVGELDDAVATVKAQQKALEMAMKPHPEDLKFAKSHATDAVRQALENGDITGAPKSTSTAATKGLAALTRGDAVEAQALLGAEALTAFDSAYQAAIQAAPNYKSRMQELNIAQQNFMQAQRSAAQIQSDLRRAAAGNIELSTQLNTRRSALQEMMTAPAPEAKTPRTFDQITPPKASAMQTSPAPGSPASSATASVNSPKMAPATSILGLLQRTPSGGELAMAPANIAAFPGRVLDTAGRYGSAALQGIYDGNFAVPEKGSFERIGEGIGGLIGGDPFAVSQAAPVVNVDLVLAERPGGPWSEAELKAIRARNAAIPQKTFLQTIMPGAKW